MKFLNVVATVGLSFGFLSSIAHAGFSERESVGQKIMTHKSLNGVDEICVLPQHFPGAVYSSDDDKVEQKLCAIERGVNVAMCAKVKSTNPGIDIHKIPANMTSAQVEAKNCDVPGAKMIAKYKLSTSCSYTPAIVGYYHVSRMLGGMAGVSQAVLHTMDRNEHMVFAKSGVARTNPKDIIHQTWGTLLAILQGSPKINADKRAAVMTVEGDQSYGAFIVKDKDQTDYKELFTRPVAGQSRAVAFMQKNPAYLALRHEGPVRDIVGTQFTAVNVQRFVQMRDVADMVVLDTIMSQQDRFGNINGRLDYATKDQSGVHVVHADTAPAGSVPVKVMLLRDNDCGVNKTNIAGQAKMVEGLRHINPETYSRLLDLYKSSLQASTASFFKRELAFTAADYSTYQKNVAHVATVLKSACRAGSLKLDLDINAHFSGTASQASCE